MDKKIFKYFIGFLKKYTFQEILLLLLMIIASAGTLVSPYVLKLIIDKVFPSKDISLLIVILAIYSVICLLRIWLQHITTMLFEKVSNNIMKDIRMATFTHLMRLPVTYFKQNQTGDIVHRINNEVDSVHSILSSSLIRIISNVCTMFGLIIMLCTLNVKLFIISIIVFPFIFLNIYYFQPKVHAISKKANKKYSAILSYLLECFTNIKLLKSFGTYKYEEKQLSNSIDEQIDINIKRTRFISLTSCISLFLTISIPIIILYIGGTDVLAGAMTVGALVAFIQYSNRVYEPFRDLIGLYFELVRASVSMERIYEIISLPTEQLPSKLELTNHSYKKIVFDNVSFSYENNKVLNDFSFVFEVGYKYAIVGASGSGKSTILNLLCRFERPESGKITIADINIEDINLDLYRSKFNLVTQDSLIFHDTISNNIKYGNLNIENEVLLDASKKCMLLDIVKKNKDGFNTMIGDQGSTLSGGELQRVALTRAYLRSADIVILDEATSALDSETERIVINNIFHRFKNNIIFVISHRLSTLKDVDIIICIDQGRVVETGSPQDLVKRKGYYWNLFREQFDQENK